jgi:mannosyl-oligosaccharide alpha-1,2-mannosidase
MEFTRLSQLTKNSKYYDAVARIIDELDAWQNHTSLPGFWPADIDTTGCARSRAVYSAPSRNSDGTLAHVGVTPTTPEMKPLEKPDPITFNKVDGPVVDVKKPQDQEKAPDATTVVTDKPQTDNPTNKMIPLDKPDPLLFSIKEPVSTKVKRQLDSIPNVPIPNLAFPGRDPAIKEIGNVECTPSGIDTATTSSEKFTLGSTADSAFEYLSKQYLLLGGRVDQYRSMYETALNVANDKLLFRVMIPDEKREILVSGNYRMSPYSQAGEKEKLQPQGEHLTCFVGGMFAMGAKMFNRPADLDIAAKLTDGCVWAYESTTTGIMPESFDAVPCESRKSCAWNETKWWEYVDPTAEMRQELYEDELETYRSETAAAAASATKAPPTPPASGPLAAVTQAQDSARSPPKEFFVEHESDVEHYAHEKRQLGGLPDNHGNLAHSDDDIRPSPTAESEPETEFQPPSISADAPPSIYSPFKPMTREEFAKLRIEGERLAPGIHQMDARYLLR